MKITMEGKYQTRGGLRPSVPVRLLCLDGPRSVYPVVGIADRNGEREIREWTAGGLWLCGGPEGEHDLVPALTKYGGWGVVNKQGELIAAFSDKDAWYRACIRQDLFSGDSVVRLSWEN
jgi:hypothetical protein